MTDGKIGRIVVFSIGFIILVMVLVMTVYLADKVCGLPEKLNESVSAGISQKLIEDGVEAKLSDEGFPYVAYYRDGAVVIYDNAETEVYRFTLSKFLLPESEREMLANGKTFNSMDDVWSLIESYTS